MYVGYMPIFFSYGQQFFIFFLRIRFLLFAPLDYVIKMNVRNLCMISYLLSFFCIFGWIILFVIVLDDMGCYIFLLADLC